MLFFGVAETPSRQQKKEILQTLGRRRSMRERKREHFQLVLNICLAVTLHELVVAVTHIDIE